MWYIKLLCTQHIVVFTQNFNKIDKNMNKNLSLAIEKAVEKISPKDNFPIAYGIYIYHVDAGKLGEKIGRLAIIK